MKKYISLIILAACDLSGSARLSKIDDSQTYPVKIISAVQSDITPSSDPKVHEDNQNQVCTIKPLYGVCQDLEHTNYTPASPVK